MGVGLKNFGKGKKGYKGILLFAKKIRTAPSGAVLIVLSAD